MLVYTRAHRNCSGNGMDSRTINVSKRRCVKSKDVVLDRYDMKPQVREIVHVTPSNSEVVLFAGPVGIYTLSDRERYYMRCFATCVNQGYDDPVAEFCSGKSSCLRLFRSVTYGSPIQLSSAWSFCLPAVSRHRSVVRMRSHICTHLHRVFLSPPHHGVQQPCSDQRTIPASSEEHWRPFGSSSWDGLSARR